MQSDAFKMKFYLTILYFIFVGEDSADDDSSAILQGFLDIRIMGL